MKRVAVLIGAIGLAFVNAAVPAAAATGETAIGPHQLFIGLVNHDRRSATVSMACFGAIRPGQTSHPMAGQSVSVQRSLDVPGGNTGGASKIVVTFEAGVGVANPELVFRSYGTHTLPTTLVFPCAGQGTASFTPVPLTGRGRADTVTVNFAGQP